MYLKKTKTDIIDIKKMNDKKILFVNHKFQKCGVYEFGKAIANVLSNSKKYFFEYLEVDTWDDFFRFYLKEKPDVIIYNYHPSTMAWIVEKKRFTYNCHKISAIQISIIHEVTQDIADNATNLFFDYHIAADPTLLLKNPIVYKTGRLIPRYDNDIPLNTPINVGSFGFATHNKGFLKIVDLVQEEFNEAIINLNVSYAKFGDHEGINARKISEEAHQKIRKSGIILNVSHDHLNYDELLNFLGNNDINVFLYEYQTNRGISSTTDWALAVHRPLAITKSSMFRHLFTCHPSICVEDNSLKSIIKNGTKGIEKLYNEWSPDNLLWDYERIVDKIISNFSVKDQKSQMRKTIDYYLYKFHFHKLEFKIKDHYWIGKNVTNDFDGFYDEIYHPTNTNENGLNRILNSDAREIYKETINYIERAVPKIHRKKIKEANIQQAFVFDTAYRLAISNKLSSKILSIGAFEDSAAITLLKLGFSIDLIDPILNYDLSTFITKPNIKPNSYDIIIATSVIEHVEDDERFIQEIAYLLKEGGYAILTCDFNDNYKIGDEKPHENCRFYTKNDLLIRLLEKTENCSIVGNPNWSCDNYDFIYQYRFKYVFASFVFKKK